MSDEPAYVHLAGVSLRARVIPKDDRVDEDLRSKKLRSMGDNAVPMRSDVYRINADGTTEYYWVTKGDD